jgi:hypothetical protein
VVHEVRVRSVGGCGPWPMAVERDQQTGGLGKAEGKGQRMGLMPMRSPRLPHMSVPVVAQVFAAA